jgi:hypothetical protein
MIGAIVFHITAKEPETQSAIGNVVLLIIAAVVAYMRWQVLPL